MNNGLSDLLDHLDGFLNSEQAGQDAMNLSELDGFLAGMIVCPAAVLPAEWMRQVWGDSGLSLDSVEQVEAVNGLVMARYTQVVSMFDQGAYSPVFDLDDQGQVIWPIWTGGFLRAMAMRPEAWHMLGETRDEEPQQAMFTLMRLCELGSLPEEDQDAMEIDEQLISVAPDLIVQAMQIFHNANRAEGRVLPMSLEETELKTGRNDPCPCGSGQKYKKCCLNERKP